MLPQRSPRIPRPNPLSYLQSPNEPRAKFIDICCGNGRRQHSLDSGLMIFGNIVEKHMLEYESSMTGLLNILWASHSGIASSYLERQFRTATKIVGLIRSSARQPSIDDIMKQLYDHFRVCATEYENHENDLRNLIFAVIGWSTMLYTPTLKAADANISAVIDIQLAHGLEKKTVTLVQNSCQRPVGSMLRSYGLMPNVCLSSVRSPGELPTRLTVPLLNFYSLSRLGNVTITWVDDLSSHCEFDRYSKRKQLKLFRLPSFCAKISLGEKDEPFIDRLFKSHSCQKGCWSSTESVAKPYLIEVLLSYRLLFGQHASSRRLFHEQEREKASWNGTLDPLLGALCGHEYVNGFDGTEEFLHERGDYDADKNFPHLGPRLMELADYSTSQRPRNLFEVWRDQRDSERLLTFKAVIIIGVATITLGILQVVVGILQIIVSIKNKS